MEALSNSTFLLAYILSNIGALVLLVCSIKWPHMGRLLYLFLFGWACWLNLATSFNVPETYLFFADYALIPVYREFVKGLFSEHITLLVATIAICQGLIAISMLLKGIIFKTGAIGGIIFFVSIAPLGVGSAFPCTLLLAVGLWILFLNDKQGHLWQVFIERSKKTAIST